MNLYKSKNQIDLLKLKAKLRSLFIKNKRVVIFSLTLIFVMVISVFVQSQILNVKANVLPIIFGTESANFGIVFVGENLTKQVYVEYVNYSNYQNEDDAPENINYQIIEYPKPRNDIEREYCRANPTDYEKCYRDLCPFIEEISSESENDIVTSAQLTKNTDTRDNWDVILKVPGISGHLAQDHTYGFIDEEGEYGCDLSIEIDYKEEQTTSICGNGILESGEECDDGNTNNNDGCSSTCQTEGGGGGGGGGTFLTISNEQVSCSSETSVVVTWRTNKYATSRVVYGTESQISTGLFPYYGYLSSTEKYINKVTVHSMIIENLENTAYYFKPISGASPDVLGKELMFNMADCCGATVLGEEGSSNLTINKIVNDDFANPGDTVKYEITITNTGNIAAFNTVLIDTLPNGFTFKDDKTSSKTWNLGNIENGQTKEVIYDVVIDNTVEEKVYTNLAQVSADNHNQISDSADLEIRKIRILGIELSPTGFSVKEFIILISLLIISLSSILILRKKIL